MKRSISYDCDSMTDRLSATEIIIRNSGKGSVPEEQTGLSLFLISAYCFEVLRMILVVMDEGAIKSEIPEMTRAILEEIIADGDVLTVRFLDGSEVSVTA